MIWLDLVMVRGSMVENEEGKGGEKAKGNSC